MNKEISKNFLPSDAAIELTIRSGIPPYLDGCTYIAHAIEMFANGTTSFMDIYKAIGREYGLKPKSIIRAVGYAIAQALHLNANLSRLLNIELPPYLHNSLVISHLGYYFRRKNNNANNKHE